MYSWTVIATITMLYVLSIAQLALQWYSIKRLFINNENASQADIAFVLTLGIASVACSYVESALADALLVSR